ncbi:MAG: PKD domain-containing protein [Thermoplasmata archaeon]|nr:PKD domain-containing protein [Thermoplasmata archaeon]
MFEFPGVAVLAVALVVVFGLAGGGPGVGTPSPIVAAASGAMLNVSAQLGDWTWSGAGGPCQPESLGTFVAHFFGNATGGTAPYHFVWAFGDGTNPSTGQNTTHVFPSRPDVWNVNLTATDTLGQTGSVIVHVPPPTTSCPSENAAPLNLLLLLLVFGGPALGVGVLAVVLVRRFRRRSRR